MDQDDVGDDVEIGSRWSTTFGDEDRTANLAAQKRMIALAGSAERVIPGHDPRRFERFPARGRVARIR